MVLLVSAPGRALEIGPGFNLFATVPFSFDLFGDGNLVMLEGKPFGPGNTDTIVQRTGSLPAGGTGDTPIELVELSLQSVSPVKIGTSFYDVFVTIDKLGLGIPQPDPLPPSVGMIHVLTHVDTADGGGGTFDSPLDVVADLILQPVTGGTPLHFADPNAVHLEAMGVSWSHTPPPNYPVDDRYPAGDFYSDPIVHQGPHPVNPSSPEPTTGLLLGLGLAGFAVGRKPRMPS
jgi:hypothetical protein